MRRTSLYQKTLCRRNWETWGDVQYASRERSGSCERKRTGGRQQDIGSTTWARCAPEHLKEILHVSARIRCSVYERETDRAAYRISNPDHNSPGRAGILAPWAGRGRVLHERQWVRARKSQCAAKETTEGVPKRAHSPERAPDVRTKGERIRTGQGRQ